MTQKYNTDSQQTQPSNELLEGADTSSRSRFITSDISGRVKGSTDNIEHISSINAEE